MKASVTTRQAAEHYGIEINRQGKALCPFHNDRHPSLFVADDHYHCFACGEHGDSIDLVAKLFGLPLYGAAKRLATDFGLVPGQPVSREVQDKWKKKSEDRQLREQERLCFLNLNEYRKLLEHWMSACAPSPEFPPDDRFVEACRYLPQVQNDLDLLTEGNSYERAEVVQMVLADGRLPKLKQHLKKVQEGKELVR